MTSRAMVNKVWWTMFSIALVGAYLPAVAVGLNRLGLLNPEFHGYSLRMGGEWTPLFGTSLFRGGKEKVLYAVQSHGLLPGFADVAAISFTELDPSRLSGYKFSSFAWGHAVVVDDNDAVRDGWHSYYLPEHRMLITTHSSSFLDHIVEIRHSNP